MKNQLCFGCALIVFFCLFSVPQIFTQDEPDEDGEIGEDVWDMPVSVDLKEATIDEAVSYFAKVSGINTVLQTGIADYFATKGLTVTLKLENVSLYEALEIFAESQGLIAVHMENTVLFKGRPNPTEKNIIGKITLKNERSDITLNIYPDDISFGLKRELIEAAVHGHLGRTHMENELLELKMEKLEERLLRNREEEAEEEEAQEKEKQVF